MAAFGGVAEVLFLGKGDDVAEFGQGHWLQSVWLRKRVKQWAVA